MGYFDAITSSSFKTAKDGRRLFFPWGVFGRGYLIPTEQDFERLHRKVKIYTMVTLPISIAVGAAFGIVGVIMLLPLVMVPYILWAHFQCRDMVSVEEKYTFSESMANQAKGHGRFVLWLLQIAAAAFVAGGIFILIVDPDKWLLAMAGILFFGYCAFMGAKMIAIKNRQDSQSDN